MCKKTSDDLVLKQRRMLLIIQTCKAKQIYMTAEVIYKEVRNNLFFSFASDMTDGFYCNINDNKTKSYHNYDEDIGVFKYFEQPNVRSMNC